MLANPNPYTTEDRTELRNSIENPNVPLSEANVDEWLGSSTRSDSGIAVSHQAAMRVAAFWQGVTMISGDVAKVPLEIYRRKEGTDREIASNHPAYRVVRFQPNEDQTAAMFFQQMVCHRLVWGNAYALIDRNGRGDVTGLYPLLPDRTTLVKDPANGNRYYRSEIDGELRNFPAYDIWHMRGISFDGLSGLDPVRYMRQMLGKILAKQRFASKFFKRGGRVGGILQLQDPRSNPKKRQANQRKEEDFRRTYENVDDSFKTIILDENAKFHQAQASFSDTQMIETGKEDVKEIARMLNMPPHKLGAEGNSSYNSLEQENQAYYDNCLSHIFRSIADQCYLRVFAKKTREAGKLYFEHTIGALLWADSKTVANIGSNGVRSGWLTRNDVRKWFNLNSIPDGDQLLIPSGMVVAGSATQTDEDDDSQRSLREGIEQVIAETLTRFRKRLAVTARRQIRDGQPFSFNKQTEAGEQMFAAVRNAAAAIDINFSTVPEMVDEFRNSLVELERRDQIILLEKVSNAT
mgnify:CR=1 FL=1